MKALIERILTDESARDSSAEVHLAAAASEFYPWSSASEQ